MFAGTLPDRHLLPDLRGGVHQLAGEDDPHCESEHSLSLSLSLSLTLCLLNSISLLHWILELRDCQEQKLTIETSLCSRLKIQNLKYLIQFQLNFAVGITNLLYFLLRLLATEDFLMFMFEMETIGRIELYDK